MSTSVHTARKETDRCQDARSTITTTQTLADSVENPQELISLYGRVPSLDTVKIRSIHLSRLGPMAKLRIDLPTYPDAAPAEWKEFDCDTVQCQVEFVNVSSFRMRNSALPTMADITFSISEGTATVEIEGPGLSAAFTCLPFTLVGHIGAFKASNDGSDSGRHYYVRKIDAKLFDSTPSLHQRTFYDSI
ncbi:Imm50 family immunity protein [Streptomyces sp. G7(2002)]|uniref:Imm50 family immunity protein n=1 Tax=Streptomyces sp. G7(2002) TaxID=2971798 RepID=UPI00237D9023|nr:Imm50 family immunity protein [Streptomyces sp. G7(2002)]WDT55654.1 immunity 50 family protein [Streptomyces sp. G7(2002)]